MEHDHQRGMQDPRLEVSNPRMDALVHTHLVESLAHNLTDRREATDERGKRAAKREGILLVSMAIGRHLDPYLLMREARTLLDEQRKRAAQTEKG